MPTQLLIVDDSRMSRMLLKGLVDQHHPDWVVLQATSGDEALQMARETPLDIVSMDYNMQGLNGLDAALALRELQPGVHIVLLSANVQSSVQDRARAAGIPFEPKPITADTIKALAAGTRG